MAKSLLFILNIALLYNIILTSQVPQEWSQVESLARKTIYTVQIWHEFLMQGICLVFQLTSSLTIFLIFLIHILV